MVKDQNVIIMLKGGLMQSWGAFTELCRKNKFPYQSLKAKKFPFEHDGWRIHKIKHRTKY